MVEQRTLMRDLADWLIAERANLTPRSTSANRVHKATQEFTRQAP
jgi:hypothetical protein